MENNLPESTKQGYPSPNHDQKYVSGLSTVLVATIQEAKDRISQIEYIFCSQLYPKFQSSFHTNLQKIYSEANEAAERRFKEKEKDLNLQIHNLQIGNQRVLEENERLERQNLNHLNQLLKTKDEERAKDLEMENLRLLEMQRRLEVETKEFRELLHDKDIQLKEYEEITRNLTQKLVNLENRVHELVLGLRDKTEQFNKGKELQGNLLKKIEFQAAEIMDNEQLLKNQAKENMLLASKVQSLISDAAELKREISRKNSELMLQKETNQLLQKTPSVWGEQNGSEENVDPLEKYPSERIKESFEGMESSEELLMQIQMKDSELQSERKKRRDAIAAYKRLKSQYNYLFEKYALTQENKLPLDKMEEENKTIEHNQTPVPSHEIPNDERISVDEAEALTDMKGNKPGRSSLSTSIIGAKCPDSTISYPPCGAKRPHSYWRNTRSHQSRVGSDHHDDFLDTPLENIRHNVGKVKKENVPDFPEAASLNMVIDSSDDDETQNMNTEAGVQNLDMLPPPKSVPSGFKYVEPVRKKAERENLMGIECKQCKKFYDAVLPAAGKDSSHDNQTLRCEHHDGVSRHRYRYAPPSTPDGFWNIGFESEM